MSNLHCLTVIVMHIELRYKIVLLKKSHKLTPNTSPRKTLVFVMNSESGYLLCFYYEQSLEKWIFWEIWVYFQSNILNFLRSITLEILWWLKRGINLGLISPTIGLFALYRICRVRRGVMSGTYWWWLLAEGCWLTPDSGNKLLSNFLSNNKSWYWAQLL